jgi:hypothetical protein
MCKMYFMIVFLIKKVIHPDIQTSVDNEKNKQR